MNFYNDDDKKAGAPVIPGAASPFKKTSAFGKAPMFSRAAGSIFDRLKNLSRKDMAFVGIGLSVLVMAPVAEYMMSQPEATPGLSGSGFGDRAGNPNLFEPGVNGLSQGSADGSGEVITPLTARDPASLILGSQPAQPVMPVSMPPPASSYRDSMKDAARESFSAATKSAGAPTPIPRMAASLRSMSFFGGDGGSRSSGVLGGGKIIENAKSASSKASKRSMVGPVAMAGYKGVASNTPNSASKGAFEKLRSQADKSAGNFSGGSAMTSLEKAAADAVQLGAGAGGAGGLAEGEKATRPSGSTSKYDHSRSGETLAEMAAKARQQKALEWEFFKKYEIPKQIINAVVGEVAKWFAGGVSRALNGPGSGPTTYVCVNKKDKAGECEPVNFRVILRTSDEKTADSWKGNTNLCPCAVMTSEEYAAAIAGIGGGTPTATATGTGTTTGGTTGTGTGGTTGGATGTATGTGTGTGVAQAPAVTEAFKDYDTTLRMMLEDVKGGIAATDPKVLLDKSIAIAGGFANLRVDAVVTRVNNLTQSGQSDQVAAYERAIQDGDLKLEASKTNYRAFRAKFDRIKQAADAGTLISGSTQIEGGMTVSANNSATVKPYLAKAKDSLDTQEALYIGMADKKIAFHKQALTVYQKQGGYATALASGVSEDYLGSVLKSANESLAELNRVKTEIAAAGAPSAEQIGIIKDQFKAISGYDSQIQVPAAPQTITVSVPAADLRTAVADASAALINKPILWRGLKQTEPYTADKANDEDVVKAEGAAWAVVAPLTKGGDISKLVDLNNLPAESLLSGAMRGGAEIPNDAEKAKVDPGLAADLMTPIFTKTEEIRAALATWNINMDNFAGTSTGAGTTTGTSSATGSATGTGSGSGTGTGSGSGSTTGAGTSTNTGGNTGGTNAAVSRADSVLRGFDPIIASDQVEYNAIYAKRANCTSAICRQNLATSATQLERMKTLRSDVAALREQAVQPGADIPALERQITDKQSAFTNAHRQFAAAAAIVKEREAIPSVSHNTKPGAGTGTGSGTGSGTSGIDPQRAAAFRATLQTKNQAIQDARREMDVAVAASHRAKATFDAAFKKCDDRCDGVIGENACWAVCKVETQFEAKNRAFTQANQSALSRIQYVSQKKRDCATFMGTVPANYRPVVGTCEN